MYTVMLLALLEQHIEVEDAVKVAAVEENGRFHIPNEEGVYSGSRFCSQYIGARS